MIVTKELISVKKLNFTLKLVEYSYLPDILCHISEFPKIRTFSYCVGGRHLNSTTNTIDDTTTITKNGKEIKLLIDRC